MKKLTIKLILIFIVAAFLLHLQLSWWTPILLVIIFVIVLI